MSQIAVIEIGERRMRPVYAAPHFSADDKERHRRAMIGSVRRILRHATTEFRERHREDFVGHLMRGEVGVERAQAVAEIA